MVLGMRIVDAIGLAIVIGLIVRFGSGFAQAVNGVGSATANVVHQLTLADVSA